MANGRPPLLVAALVLVAGGPATALPCPRDGAIAQSPYDGTVVEEGAIDPHRFMSDLIARYRGLTAYEDVAQVSHEITRDGADPMRVRTKVGCELADGRLRVITPWSHVWRALGRAIGVEVPAGPAAETGARPTDYDLWLAPHMTLKFADDPMREFRRGVDEGFTPTGAEPVTIDDRPLVHVELRSGDGLSADCAATFDLYVNPESMLVERIEGQQRLPDGASYETTLDITPTRYEPALSGDGDAPASHDGAGGAPAPAPAPAPPVGGVSAVRAPRTLR
jgi:hypothetical protein